MKHIGKALMLIGLSVTLLLGRSSVPQSFSSCVRTVDGCVDNGCSPQGFCDDLCHCIF